MFNPVRLIEYIPQIVFGLSNVVVSSTSFMGDPIVRLRHTFGIKPFDFVEHMAIHHSK